MQIVAGGFLGWIAGTLLAAVLMPIILSVIVLFVAMFVTIILKACESNSPRRAAHCISRECVTGYYDENGKWHFPLNSRGRWKKKW